MKKPLLILFFIPLFTSAQNWSIFNSAEKFNYRLDGDNVITATILVDSVQMNGSDSIFFLNRIMCDTCATIIGGPNACDTCYGKINQPQFLQREVHLSASGIFNLRDTGNLVINSLAAVNDSWIFDSVYNINATVSSVTLDSVFGTADSVKTILLSTGDTIRLSESFGLLQYPRSYGLNSYYRLTGIEGRNVGELSPKFFDFFNFDVGDMFEFHESGIFDGACFYDRRKKYEIISKQFAGDSVIYSVSGVVLDSNWTFIGGCSGSTFRGPYSTTLIYVDSALHFANSYNHQVLKLRNDLHGIQLDSAYDHTRIRLDSNQVLTKSFVGKTSTFSNYIFYYPTSTPDVFYPYNSLNFMCTFSQTYKAGLGLTDFIFGYCTEGYDESHLVAYRKGNDTVGVFTPDSIILKANDLELEEEYISFYPNPTTGKFSISIPVTTAIQETSAVEVYNLLGEKQKAILFRNHPSEVVDISSIPAGIYIIELNTGTQIYHRTLVKQ
jgi:hypothetical protein